MMDMAAIHSACHMVTELAAAGAFKNTRSATAFNNWAKEHKDTISFNFTVSAGCFKIVIIPTDADFVIKTAITYEWRIDQPTRTIEEQHEEQNGPYAEFQQWNLIEKTSFKDYFLETNYLMSIEEHEFFIQPKAICDECAITDSLRAYIDTDEFFDEDELNEYLEYDYELDTLLCSLWGNDNGEDLQNFLEEMDITDIHKGNIGRFNGEWVIIDYAS